LSYQAVSSEQISHDRTRRNIGSLCPNSLSSVLDKKSRGMGSLTREVIETELHADNLNREEGFFLSKSWKPLVQTLEERKKGPV